MKNLTTNGFNGYKIIDLLSKASYILSCMLSEPLLFPTPNPTFVAVQNALDQLTAAEAEAKNGDKMKILDRDQKQATLISLLQQLGTYVNNVADGNRDIAARSGFDIRKLAEPRILNPVITGPKLQRTNSPGGIDASIVLQKGVTKGINWYVTENPALPIPEWKSYINQTSKITLENLTPGVLHHVCAEQMGSRKQRQMSPVSTIIP